MEPGVGSAKVQVEKSPVQACQKSGVSIVGIGSFTLQPRMVEDTFAVCNCQNLITVLGFSEESSVVVLKDTVMAIFVDLPVISQITLTWKCISWIWKFINIFQACGIYHQIVTCEKFIYFL